MHFYWYRSWNAIWHGCVRPILGSSHFEGPGIEGPTCDPSTQDCGIPITKWPPLKSCDISEVGHQKRRGSEADTPSSCLTHVTTPTMNWSGLFFILYHCSSNNCFYQGDVIIKCRNIISPLSWIGQHLPRVFNEKNKKTDLFDLFLFILYLIQSDRGELMLFWIITVLLSVW